MKSDTKLKMITNLSPHPLASFLNWINNKKIFKNVQICEAICVHVGTSFLGENSYVNQTIQALFVKFLISKWLFSFLKIQMDFLTSKKEEFLISKFWFFWYQKMLFIFYSDIKYQLLEVKNFIFWYRKMKNIFWYPKFDLFKFYFH